MKTAIAISPMMRNALSVAKIPLAAVTASQMRRIAPRIVPMIRPMPPVCARRPWLAAVAPAAWHARPGRQGAPAGTGGVGPDRPRIVVELSGDLGRLRPSVDAALYRLAQESITNARRHARHASCIRVLVSGEPDLVRLTVADDGHPVPPGSRPSSGFGLIGMAERARLLGGTLDAGPNRNRGWTVHAVLPTAGGRS